MSPTGLQDVKQIEVLLTCLLEYSAAVSFDPTYYCGTRFYSPKSSEPPKELTAGF